MREDAEDWQLLNAYADGELEPGELEAVEARLHAEPDLRADLQKIRNLKRGLADLKVADGPQQTASWRSVVRPRVAAIAATLLVLVVGVGALAAWQFDRPGWRATVVAIHDRLSGETYVVDQDHAVRIVSGGSALELQAPDLTASRLFLVDVVNGTPGGAEAIALHYRGLRGCRLSIVAIEHARDEPGAAAGESMVHSWAAGTTRFAVVAAGMDKDRFASIVAYAQTSIEDDLAREKDLLVAMDESYKSAAPCA